MERRRASWDRARRLPLVALLLAMGLGAGFAGRHQAGATTARDQTVTTPDGVQHTLRVAAGLRLSIYASGLGGPRFMALGPRGDILVTEIGTGGLAVVRSSPGATRAARVVPLLNGLDTPHGIAYRDGRLYLGEQGRISVMRYDAARVRVSAPQPIISDLPTGSGHSTRTVSFGPDGMLYVSAGSSCNVCIESDWHRATVLRYRPDGSGGSVFARGLRNSVGLAWQPGTGLLWATENGRDNLGDNTPPDEINIIRRGADYGWPYCWGDRRQDPDVGKPGYCAHTIPPVVALQAHSAPLGLAFYTAKLLPDRYRGGLFVAFHGSWNRSQPTGYKLVYLPVSGTHAGPIQDVVTGWLPADATNGPDQSWGRPVGVLVAADGSLLISDDKAGVIYRLAPSGRS